MTPGNNYLALGYHQIQECTQSKHIELVKIMGYNNVSDFGTKPVDKPVVDSLLIYYSLKLLHRVPRRAARVRTGSDEEKQEDHGDASSMASRVWFGKGRRRRTRASVQLQATKR